MVIITINIVVIIKIEVIHIFVDQIIIEVVAEAVAVAEAVVGVAVADADFQTEINLIEIQDRMATNHLYQDMHHKIVSYVVFGDMKQINVDGYIVDFHI